MKEVFGDIWKYKADCVCITTNGIVTKSGACVMGKGVALQAKTKFPGIEYLLGSMIQKSGNQVYFFNWWEICTFPTKYHWKEKADLKLIEKSAKELALIASRSHDKIFVLPRPGCGNGGLKWEEVKLIIEPILPDNVHVIEREVIE